MGCAHPHTPQRMRNTAHTGVWAAISVASAGGLWYVGVCTCHGTPRLHQHNRAEKTRLGKELSGYVYTHSHHNTLIIPESHLIISPLVSTLLGLAMSNAGLIPAEFPPVYGTINGYLLPLAVPLLLFTADLRRVVRDTGRLLGAFLVGSVATVLGTLAAWQLFPLHGMGNDGWKVAAALAARHIGGAVNYVGVCETLDVSASAQMAGLAADNLICALYFTTIFALARGIPADSSADGAIAAPEGEGMTGSRSIGVLEGCTAIALSACICFAGTLAAKQFGWGTIPMVTAITVALATFAPGMVAPLAASGEGLAAILMQVFFAGVGANGSVAAVIATAPALFAFSTLQLVVHVALILAIGRLMGFTRRELLLASNANVGGPTTAAGLAAAKGWRASLVPALLVGVFGYAIATFLAVALGTKLLATW